MNTALKIGLVLGGGYLLMRYTGLKLPGGAAVAPPNGSKVPETGPKLVPPAGNKTDVTNPPQTTAPKVSDEIIRRAAGGDAEAVRVADKGGVRFNADQWNWFRQQDTGQETTTDLFPEGNRGALMTASEYLERRIAAGLGYLVIGRRAGWA